MVPETDDLPVFEPFRKRNWGGSDHALECLGKKRYPSEQRAKYAAIGLRLSGERTHAYKCFWCAYFHLAHVDPQFKP